VGAVAIEVGSVVVVDEVMESPLSLTPTQTARLSLTPRPENTPVSQPVSIQGFQDVS
jgi:hypothetical protein